MTTPEQLTSLRNLLMGKTLSKAELECHLTSYLEYTKSTANVFSEGELFSVAFFLLLKQCQSIYSPEKKHANDVPEKIQQVILAAFSNIAQLIHGISAEQRLRNSYIQVIWFLHELRTQCMDASYQIQEADLGASSSALLEVLGDISFIFDIEENGRAVFPINQLIVNVISEEDFISTRLSPDKIQILQLAVRLFDTGEGRAILDKLHSSCNLGFLDYLGPDSIYIDSPDKLNYRKNKTMIFYRETDTSILVRTENPCYFLSAPLPPEYEKAEEETDVSGTRVIGYYVTYTIDERDERTSFDKEIQNTVSAQNLLSLLFDQQACNIFLDDCIIKHPDGTYSPMNLWCSQDSWIVKETGTYYPSLDLRKAINEFRLYPVKQSIENKLNYVSFGLCVLLLTSANVGVKALELDNLEKTEWYQSQVLTKWLINPKVSFNAKIQVLSELQEQLEYCQNTQTFKNAELAPRDFLPFRFSISCLYPFLFPSLTDHILLKGEVSESGDSLHVLPGETVSGKANKDKLYELAVPIASLLDQNGIIADLSPSTPYYFFYSIESQTGQVESQRELGILSGIEQIEANYVMDTDVGLKVYSAHFKVAKDRMKLYDKSYEQKAKDAKIRIPFETQAAIRLLHNMLYYRITADLVAPFFEILAHHAIADFAGIEKDTQYYHPEEGTLYVPKDKFAARATLADIFNDMNDASIRDPACIFEQSLTFNGRKYGINSAPISNIVFLTDNFEFGKSTMAMLAAYLNLPERAPYLLQARIDKAKDKIHCYTCGEQVVSLTELINTNAPNSITVRAYYGTDVGKVAIEEYLSDNGFGMIKVEYRHKLENTYSEIEDQVKQLGLEYESRYSNNYLLIRKHNMTKWSAFSSETLNVNKLISMFNKRPET